MSPKAASCLIFLLAAGPAVAEPIKLIPGAAAEAEQEKPEAPPRDQLFISPSGQPFRAPPSAPYPVEAWFGGADKDGDGALTAEEFAADHQGFFETLDANADGVVDGFEAAAYEKEIAPEVLARGLRRAPRKGGWFRGGRKPIPGAGREGAGLYGLINEPLPVRAADGDFDYRITAGEWAAAAQRRFEMLDRDKSRRLTLAELPKTPVQIAAEQRRADDNP